jgi:hypothetical protein
MLASLSSIAVIVIILVLAFSPTVKDVHLRAVLL